MKCQATIITTISIFCRQIGRKSPSMPLAKSQQVALQAEPSQKNGTAQFLGSLLVSLRSSRTSGLPRRANELRRQDWQQAQPSSCRATHSSSPQEQRSEKSRLLTCPSRPTRDSKVSSP